MKIFDSPNQIALEKYFANNVSSTKPAHLAPPIDSEFTDINGQEWYRLSNGNEILKEKYISMWLPAKQTVKPFNHKGDNPDKTKVV